MVPPLDECKFCVREFWQPWLQELLDIEDEARVEERKAIFAARDALSKSERDLALNLRLYAAEALLSIRAAKKDVMKAIAVIEAEKAKRKSIDKEKYGIYIKRTDANTHYKEVMAKAFKSKQIQENKFEIMKLWSEKWAIREARQFSEEEEEKEIPKTKPKSVLKHHDTDEHGSKSASHLLIQDEDTYTENSPSHKPALKKKDDGHHVDADPAEKKDSGHKHSKDKEPPEKTEHKTSHSRDKGTGSNQGLGPSPAHGVDKGTAIQDKKIVASPAHGADKGSIAFKEPEPAHETAAGTVKAKESEKAHVPETADKKEPSSTNVKGTTENKALAAPATPDKKTEPAQPSGPKLETKAPPDKKKES